MENYRIYEPEAATILFEELENIVKSLSDYRTAYRNLNKVFIKCLDQKTNLAGIRMSGPFAKVDYLLKEYKAPRYLRAVVNDARVRFRKMRGLDDQTLVDNFWYDFKAVCQFVELVYQVPVPTIIEVRFPQKRTIQRGKLTAECLRIIVNRWDDTYLYAEADEEGMEEVKVFYSGTSDNFVYKEWNWAYIQHILTVNCQLNLVRPREKDGILYPELIIFEPDYLVDISAIASCFESYSNSYINYLLDKIKPSPNTSPIVLGHLASQFLDEGLSLYPEDCSYKQSIQQFFKSNALSLLTAGLEANFHSNAQSQKQNIQHVLHKVLPQVFSNDGIKHFDSSEIIVEPSFFSEMLGIQGRMDFLQLDQKLLIEQKSGKAAFPEQDPPRPVEKHKVQVLLYLMLLRYNNRALYERNGRNVHIMLLYSKYKNGLVDFGSSAPELMFEAIKVRNEIVANEYKYTRGGISILSSITPDGLNQNGSSGVLWERYQKPQIDALLSPIHASSELERAYYFRFLTFLETEHIMAKVGNQTKENSGFADKWHSTLEEKLLAGNIYCDLDLLSPLASEKGKVEQVTLQFAQRPDNDISNFRPGDIVVLYPYDEGTEPDARQTMVFRSTIECISEDRLILNLRSSQANANVFWHNGKKKWAIEHDFFESSFGSLYKGMHAFLSAPQERKDLLLLQRAPQSDKNRVLKGDYGDFNTLAIKAKQANDLFLIIGPPGTGKTSFGLLNTLQEELLSTQSSILLLSYTNRAVDEICSKLVEKGIDYIRIGGKFSCEDAYRPSLLETKVQGCKNIDELKQLIDRTRVFVGTTTAFNSNINLFQIKSFSLAIIDEASQILEPHLIGLLSAKAANGNCAIKKIVMIGDHKQLPAVVQQKEEDSFVNEPILNDIHLTNCRLSLFERLLKQYRDNRDVLYMLTKQGRMHHDIAQFPNYSFYQNKLSEVPCPHQNAVLSKQGKGVNGIDDILTTRRISFIAVQPPQHSPSDKVNSNEALAIAATVHRIYELNKESFSPTQTVGVIVPYRNQIAEVRKAIEKNNIPVLQDITIDTVERYQGSQRDYIIYGFTIQKYYQLNFLTNNTFEEDDCIIDRKLNVAMTRAKEHLLMFGNPDLLVNNITFFKLIEFIRSKHGYFSVNLSDYTKGVFIVPELEKDLDLSQAAFTLSPEFEAAFNQLILEPIQKDKRTDWPELILGRNMTANLDAIGYGRINFSNQLQAFDNVVTPREQVLLYCYYIMRMYYCSSKSLFSSIDSWMKPLIQDFNGRMQFIDIGCGPATCGLAFAEQFLKTAPQMQYTGIDVSTEMKRIGEQFVVSVFDSALRFKTITAFGELGDDYWDSVSEAPSLIVLNFSYVFSNLSSDFTQHLAQHLSSVIQKYPLNKYVFFIQHSDCDTKLNSYRVFKDILSPFVTTYKKAHASFNYKLNYKERSKEFCYEILATLIQF